MNSRLIAIALAALVTWGADAHGQQATERYIPLGQSPGISGTQSDNGEIAAVNARAGTFTVTGPDGPRTVKVTDRTRIWLDRSQQGATNTVGTVSDLQAGRRVEVRYVDASTRQNADWIKVAVPGGS
jgi:hypothetical protein